jgi:Domain of unknown function (DUF4383)
MTPTTSRLSPVQWSAILGALAVLLWSVPGLFVNPDFATGDAATSKLVLGVDMNGWHAVSGFLIAVPAFWFATRADRAALFVPLAAASLIATGVWALLDKQPAAGLFYFPHNHTDAWLHFGVAAIFLAGFAHYLVTRKSLATR